MLEKKILLQFGAGKIGRSFIAQLFSKAGYQIVFADIDPCLVKSINEAGHYNVIIKGPDFEDRYIVDDIKAIEIGTGKKVVTYITEADILSISVGKKSLLNLAELLARGIKNRYLTRRNSPLDIILAENVRDAASLISAKISEYIPEIDLDEYVGFVETSIGKMVPLMTAEHLRKDPLAIHTEAYNTLIVDELGFRNKIPDIPELLPKKNMKAWVDRRFFIHNLGHVVLAYQSHYLYPEIKYIWEAINRKDLYTTTRNTMLQSASILQNLYPEEFTLLQLEEHIDDLLHRFSNKALMDTVFRVGSDLARKLSTEDRLITPILQAMNLNMEYDLILDAWVKGCYFAAEDEDGNVRIEDSNFRKKYNHDAKEILMGHCQLPPETEGFLAVKIDELVRNLNKTGEKANT